MEIGLWKAKEEVYRVRVGPPCFRFGQADQRFWLVPLVQPHFDLEGNSEGERHSRFEVKYSRASCSYHDQYPDEQYTNCYWTR